MGKFNARVEMSKHWLDSSAVQGEAAGEKEREKEGGPDDTKHYRKGSLLVANV